MKAINWVKVQSQILLDLKDKRQMRKKGASKGNFLCLVYNNKLNISFKRKKEKKIHTYTSNSSTFKGETFTNDMCRTCILR